MSLVGKTTGKYRVLIKSWQPQHLVPHPCRNRSQSNVCSSYVA